jgi:hypothetical protein
MSEGLTIIQDTGMLAEHDMVALMALSDELRQNWQAAQVFRTRTEMVVSVLNDIKHPTPDSKYWQAVREQAVMLAELVNLGYEYRKVLIELKRLHRSLLTEQDDIEIEALGVEIEQQEWIAAQMQRTAHHRAREINEWSRIKALLVPDMKHGIEDVDAHQLEAMRQRFSAEVRLVNDYTPVADARNIIGLAATAGRVAGA